MFVIRTFRLLLIAIGAFTLAKFFGDPVFREYLLVINRWEMPSSQVTDTTFVTPYKMGDSIFDTGN